MQSAIIHAIMLSRRFGDVVAVDRLSFSVAPGEVFGFLGHNGAGKTTTVRLLNGVLTPSAGGSRVLGLDPAVDGALLRRRTGILTETPSLDERLTGRLNLAVYADLYGVPEAQVERRVTDLLALFELSQRADDRVAGYSKGMKQRLALARALLHEPEILFLDEPTSGLDPAATRQVHALITRLSREEGRTVFLCTHNLAEAQELCQRVAVLEQGRLLALGTPDELARQTHRTQRLDLEVAPEHTATAAALAERLGGTVEAPLTSGRLTVAGLVRETVPQLLTLLVGEGIPVYRVDPRLPSLADVYFALHEETR